jgi:hypothetical protein
MNCKGRVDVDCDIFRRRLSSLGVAKKAVRIVGTCAAASACCCCCSCPVAMSACSPWTPIIPTSPCCWARRPCWAIIALPMAAACSSDGEQWPDRWSDGQAPANASSYGQERAAPRRARARTERTTMVSASSRTMAAGFMRAAAAV